MLDILTQYFLARTGMVHMGLPRSMAQGKKLSATFKALLSGCFGACTQGISEN